MAKRLLLCFLIFYSIQSFTQNFYSKQFNYLNGLPTMRIYNLFCADDGFIWIGSEIGLIRYDGVSFEVFSTEDGLPDTEVTHVFGDKENRIWGITFNGKIFFIKDHKVYNEANSSLLNELNNKYDIANYLLTVSSELYLYSLSDLVKIENETITSIPYKNEATCNISSRLYEIDKKIYFSVLCGTERINFNIENDVASLNEDDISLPLQYSVSNSNDQSYYITNKGIVSNKYAKLIIPEKFNPLLSEITNLYVDSNNDLWYFDLNKGIQYFHNGVLTTLLPDYKVNSISQDFEGNYWISTISNGLFVFYSDFFNKQEMLATEEAKLLPINCLYIDNQDNIWAGNSFANITLIDNKNNKQNLDLIEINKYTRIIDFDVAGNSLLAASDEGIFVINRNEIKLTAKKVGGRTVKSLSVHHENEFAAAYSYGISIFKNKNNIWLEKQIFANRSFSVQYNKNMLWFSSEKGIFNYNGSINRINIPELDGKRVLDMAFFEKGNLILISTDGYGIYAIDDTDYSIKWRAESKNGLTTNLTRQMQLVGDTLWVNSPAGLNRLKMGRNGFQKLTPLTTSNGLPSDDIRDFYIKGNTLAIAGDFGVLKWNNFTRHINLSAPKFHITNIISDKGTYNSDDKIISDYKKGLIRIQYSAIQYASTIPMIEYSIDNGTWQTAAVSVLELSSLSPGPHHLQFRLLHNNSLRLNTNSINIFIEAPFYAQKWFIPLCIGLIAIMISSLIIYRLNKTKKKAVLQLKLSEDLTFAEQQALQSMMNPHFIFNAVNSVQQYIIRNDKKEANKYLTQFARLIRLNLETSKNKYITLEEEIERLSLYLQFEKVRFGDKLEYSITVTPELEADKIYIPSMIIQPFVENAIWHGLIPKTENGHVNINIEKQDSNIIIKVIDNGVGYTTADPVKTNSIKTSMGSFITKRRLELLEKQTGKAHFFKILATDPLRETGKGVTVVITIPLNSSAA